MDWIRDHLWETWLALAIALGVAEMFSLDLILAMLAAGAVVGMVAAPPDRPGGGDGSDLEEQPHAKQITHAPQSALSCPDWGREAVPVARHGERTVPDARREGARRGKGE